MAETGFALVLRYSFYRFLHEVLHENHDVSITPLSPITTGRADKKNTTHHRDDTLRSRGTTSHCSAPARFPIRRSSFAGTSAPLPCYCRYSALPAAFPALFPRLTLQTRPAYNIASMCRMSAEVHEKCRTLLIHDGEVELRVPIVYRDKHTVVGLPGG